MLEIFKDVKISVFTVLTTIGPTLHHAFKKIIKNKIKYRLSVTLIGTAGH